MPNPLKSLAGRLLLAATLVLAAFLGLTGMALDSAYQSSAMEAARERLQARVYLLLGTANVSDTGQVELPDALPDAALSAPGSGVYAAALDQDGNVLWESPSTLATGLRWPVVADRESPAAIAAAATNATDNLANPDDETLTGELITTTETLALRSAVIWELDSGVELQLVFAAAESTRFVQDQLREFRTTLLTWLGSAAAALLLIQALLLLWGLAPLRQVAREVSEIESGRRDTLSNNYPSELRGLSDGLNGLLHASRASLQRYRDSLADLAHSLKTPLAVLRSALEESNPDQLRSTAAEQLERMDQTVSYQLQRAATSGRGAMTQRIDIGAIAQRIAASLDKVYRDKGLQLTLDIPAGTYFNGDPGDLTEIIGNLADNACKWAAHKVLLRARTGDDARLLLDIEDDGPGIPADRRADVLRRGVRADSLVPGQGIGLAVVREMVEAAYGGTLQIETSPLGGASLKVCL